MHWRKGAPLPMKSSEHSNYGHKKTIHTRLHKNKALADRYEKTVVSDSKSLFLCPCEKCQKMYIRAPSARIP